jgi:hypothetical protein
MISWPFGHPAPHLVNAMPNIGLQPTADGESIWFRRG